MDFLTSLWMETDTKLVGKKIQKRTFMSFFFLLVVFTVLPFFLLAGGSQPAVQPEGSVSVYHGPAEDEVLWHAGAQRDPRAAAGGHAVTAATGAKGSFLVPSATWKCARCDSGKVELQTDPGVAPSRCVGLCNALLTLPLGGSGGGEKWSHLQPGCQAVWDPHWTEFSSEETWREEPHCDPSKGHSKGQWGREGRSRPRSLRR